MIPYREGLKERAKQLRSNSTKAEALLWTRIKNKQLSVDFDRQKPLLGFIVDFYCKTLRLAIELDGSSHEGKDLYDTERENSIKQYNVTFLRFTNEQVYLDIQSVLDSIRFSIASISPPTEGCPKGGVGLQEG